MDKKLKAYIEEAEKLAKKPDAAKLEYHLSMLQHFQHEREVHLFVTLAFALYMIIMFLAFMAFSITVDSSLISTCFGIITAILTVTTLFYVRHYYKLENGVQKLEEITKKLYNRD